MGVRGFVASQGTKKFLPANWWLLGPSQTLQGHVPFSHYSLSEPVVKIISILERNAEIFQTIMNDLFWSFLIFWEQLMGISGNALSIRAVYWHKMSQNIGNIHIL